MFTKAITSTPFTSELANSIFGSVSGDPYRGDISFLSTLRALVAPRANSEPLELRFTSSDYSLSILNGVQSSAIIDALFNQAEAMYSSRITIHSLMSDAEANALMMRCLESNMPGEHASYERLDRVNVFFKQAFPVHCFASKEKKSTIIFVERLNNRKLHALQMGVLAYFPWYFSPSDTIEPEELALLQSFKNTDESEFLRCTDVLAAKVDFRSHLIKTQLAGFESRYERTQIESVRHDIIRREQKMAEYQEQYRRLLGECRDLNVRLLGLETMAGRKGENSELMEFFLHNRMLYLENVRGSSVKFCVAGPLSYYDEEMVRRVVDNRHSYLYVDEHGEMRNSRNSIDPNRMRKLIEAVFLKKILKLRVCARYSVDMRDGAEGHQREDYPSELRDYLPNPHIEGFGCLGSHHEAINALMREGEFVGVVEQCAASCLNLNWHDSVVMRRFMKEMYDPRQSRRFIELPDGSTVTPLQAIEWLEAQEAVA